jgi:hypothetical protein
MKIEINFCALISYRSYRSEKRNESDFPTYKTEVTVAKVNLVSVTNKNT